MTTRSLGTTGQTVSAVGFGAMHLSLSGRPPDADAIEVIHRVLDAGVTFIDTADAYCTNESDKHHNEHLIRRALETYDGDASNVVVATKGGLMRPDGRWTRNGDPEHLHETIHESVDALGGPPIDLWQHHAPDPDVPVEASLAAVRDAVDDGLIRFVGVSNYSVEQIERAQTVVDVVSVQNQYSPWHRRPESSGVLNHCERNDLVFLPWSPLGGRSRARSLDRFSVLTDLATAKGVSPQRLVLAWLLHRSPAILPIPGASRVESATDSVQAWTVSLSDDEVARIDAATT